MRCPIYFAFYYGFAKDMTLNNKQLKTPRQEDVSCRGVGQKVMGVLGMVRGGCKRCDSRGPGWWEGAGCLRRRSGGNREPWRSVSASG